MDQEAQEAAIVERALATLPVELAVLDATGTIQTTSDGWRSFVSSNPLHTDEAVTGSNYLDTIAVDTAEFGDQIEEGIRAVLDGQREEFTLEYPVSEMDRTEWFHLTVRAFTDNGDRQVTVGHVHRSEQKASEPARRRAYELKRRNYEQTLHTLGVAFPDLGFVIDEEGRYLEALTSPSVEELLYVNPEDFLGKQMHDVMPEDVADRSFAAVTMAIETGDLQTLEYELPIEDTHRWFEARLAPFPQGYYGRDAVVCLVRDITDRKEREKRLQTQRDELTQLQRLNTLVREMICALPETATRNEIETAVCDHLTAADLYRAVWIGTRDTDRTGEPTVSVETAAGIAPDAIEQTAIECASQAVRETEIVTEEHCVAVPLATSDSSYGVLVVEPPCEHHLSPAEHDLLSDLGEILALEIRRVHSERSLAADTVLRLQVRIPELALFSREITADSDCELRLKQRVPTDEKTVYYLSVLSGDPAEIASKLAETPRIESCSVIRDGTETDRPALVEARQEEEARGLIDVLLDYGAAIQEVSASNGRLRIELDVPPEVGARTVIERLQDVVPETEFVSKQLVERELAAVTDLESSIFDDLTPKQETTLQAAYARGYYEWPRDSTAEELAAAMSITPATLHYRLRQAHQTVMDTILSDPSGTTEP